jgi:hypothetical protein
LISPISSGTTAYYPSYCATSDYVATQSTDNFVSYGLALFPRVSVSFRHLVHATSRLPDESVRLVAGKATHGLAMPLPRWGIDGFTIY